MRILQQAFWWHTCFWVSATADGHICVRMIIIVIKHNTGHTKLPTYAPIANLNFQDSDCIWQFPRWHKPLCEHLWNQHLHAGMTHFAEHPQSTRAGATSRTSQTSPGAFMRKFCNLATAHCAATLVFTCKVHFKTQQSLSQHDGHIVQQDYHNTYSQEEHKFGIQQ